MNRKFKIRTSELVVASGELDQRFEMAFQANEFLCKFDIYFGI